MKHFLVDIEYIVEFEKILKILPEHREFLQTGYDQNILLMSGPKNPKTGGIVIARSESKNALDLFFQNDPYAKENYAVYSFTEFEPVKNQSFMQNWIME